MGDDVEPWTVQRLMDWTRQFLHRRGIEDPRLAAELLLAHALGVRKIELYARYHDRVGEPALGRFRELVRRAAGHEPIGYLVGYREFFSLPFKVTPDVLIPRPETETLVQEVICQARRGGQDPSALRVLDIGTGSGCIAVALAIHLPGARVIATDVSAAALAVARDNAQANKAQVEFRPGPLYEPVAGEPPFDYICSNPPYISETGLAELPPAVRDYEPVGALVAGPDGLQVIRPLLAGACEHLAPGGMLFMEVAFDQARRVVPVARAAPGLADVRTVRDNLGHERVVVATRGSNGGKADMNAAPDRAVDGVAGPD